MGNISSDDKYLEDTYSENTITENDFEIITGTNNNIPVVNNENLIIDLKNIQLHFNKLFSIYKNIIQENKEKQD